MATLTDWVREKLSIFLGFDNETINDQILPYLFSLSSADQLREHLVDLVGLNDDTATFIQEFVARQFPATKPIADKGKKNKTYSELVGNLSTTASASSTSLDLGTSSQSNGQLGVANPAAPAWADPKKLYKKKDEEDYFVGKKTKSRANTPSGSRPPSPPPLSLELVSTESVSSSVLEETPPSKTQKGITTSGNLISDKLDRKKKKKADDMSLEEALRELDIDANLQTGKTRRACTCQATKHPLLTIAPNCLNCGKIICTFEGPGPCTFCGTPVLSREQQLDLISEAKKKRSSEAQAKNQKKKSKAIGASGTSPYAAKLGGMIVPRPGTPDTVAEGWVELGSEERRAREEEAEERRLKAEEHKERLLEFDRTSAKRSRVIDQAADFALPADRANIWLTPEERALQVKRQQANMKKLELRDSHQKRRVLTIDMANKKVGVEVVDMMPSDEESEGDEENTEKVISAMGRNREISAENNAYKFTGTYSRNPLLNGQTPRFVRSIVKNEKSNTDAAESTNKSEKESNPDVVIADKQGDDRESSTKTSRITRPAIARVQNDYDVGFSEGLILGISEGGGQDYVEPSCG